MTTQSVANPTCVLEPAFASLVTASRLVCGRMHLLSIWPYFAGIVLLIGWAQLLTRGRPIDSSKLQVPLESLRGLLAVSVLFCHATVTRTYFQTGQWRAPAFGFYAFAGSAPVILFFFLSGYLFWSKCIRQGGVGSYHLYLLARARRLVPAYYASIVLVLLAVFVRTRFHLLVPIRTLGAQILGWAAFGFPALAPPLNGLADAPLMNAAVVWTLQMEIVFYLLLPVLYKLFRGRRLGLFLLVMAGSYLWLLLRGVSDTADPKVAGLGLLILFYLARFFGFGFGFGMLAAYAADRCPLWLATELSRRRWMPLAVLFLAAPVALHLTPYSFGEFLLLLFFFFFVVAGNDGWGLLAWPATFLMGSASYSFYITHGLVLFTLSHLLNLRVPFGELRPWPFWVFTWASALVALTIAVALYRVVELPFMSRSSALNKADSPPLPQLVS